MKNINVKPRTILVAAVLLPLLFVSCKSSKKLDHYSEIYQERPATIYVAPLNDLSMRRSVRTTEDSVFNASLNTAAKQLYLTASDPLTFKGYYVPGPLASAQLAATESRTGKQLRNENINDYYTDLGIDAILFITVKEWHQTSAEWSVEAEYVLRSTHTGSEIMHVSVKAAKQLSTDFKGNPKPLREDIAFAKQYGCDLETAQRCRLVQIMNQYVLKDLPSGSRAREISIERYTASHPQYFDLVIKADGSVKMLKSEDI